MAGAGAQLPPAKPNLAQSGGFKTAMVMPPETAGEPSPGPENSSNFALSGAED